MNPGRHSIEEINDAQLLDEVDDDTSGLAFKPEPTWYVQMAPGDVRAVTAEQLRDFYRLGIINRDTYLWQPATQQWLLLSAFVGNDEPAPQEEEWQVRMGPGDVRRVTLEQLDDFYRLGVVDGQTLVWQAGMASWAKLADLIGEEPEDEGDETWYALMPSGEVKQLTLEQLDDFYRVDVITERTPIWKEGMNQWLPLGTVAGIAAPSTERDAVQARSVAPATATVAPRAPHAAQTQPVVAPGASYRPPMTVPTAPPLAVTIAPPVRSSAGGRWLVRVCVAAGLLISLQRNDVLFSAAQSYRQQDKFIQVERQTLGGPGFGTPRAVEELAAAAGGQLTPVRLPWIVQERHERALRESSANSKSSAASAASNDSISSAANRVPSKLPASPSNQVKSEPAPPAAPATLSALGAAKKHVVTKAVAPKPARKATKNKAVFGAKGDRYDPLNAAL
jgi:hypothetical protein